MHGDEPVKLKPSEEKGPELVSDSINEEIEFAPLIDYFGIDRPSLEEKNDLRELYNLLCGEQRLSKGELLLKLRDIDIKLGNPPTGEKRIKRIIRFLAIDKEIEDLIKEQKSYVYTR